MSIKLLSGCPLVILVVLANGPLALAEEHKHLCPDMSDHEKVLNEGIRLHKQHGVSRAPSFDDFGGLEFHTRPRSAPPSFASDYTPSQREADSKAYWSWKEKVAAWLPLTSFSERIAAERQAQEFEEMGMYLPAQKLYKRLVDVRKSNLREEQDKIPDTLKNLERVQLCQSGSEYMMNRQYAIAIDCFGKAIENIRTSSFDIVSKSILTTSVMDRFKLADMAKGSSPGLSAEDALSAQKVKAHADEVLLAWKREMECLAMAQKLDKTAWKLEQDGQYAVAEKLYRQALLIRQKNLGLENLETLAQNGDLARVCAARGQKREACRYYEDALKAMRKLPNAGRTYATMLESYGDMLDRMNDKTRAEKIYEEARNYHEKLSAAKN